MAESERRFLSYENSVSVYRSKTAMIFGVCYFSQGYQSTPVLGMQFAEVNDPDAEQKTFNWDAEEKVWYFPSYDKCYEFYKKITKWRKILELLKSEKNTDNDVIQNRFKDFADKNKISNPVKKKSMYINVRYYNTYFLTMTLVLGKDRKISVSLYEDEFDMLLQYIGDFIKNYHNLTLLHRTMLISRGSSKPNGDGGSSSSQSKSFSGSSSSSNKSSGSSKKSNDEGPPASSSDDVDALLGGGSLEDLMAGVNADDDVPF